MQDSVYSPVTAGYYKFGYSDPGPVQYHNNSPSYEVYDHIVGMDEYTRRPADFFSGEQTTASNQHSERMSNIHVNTSNRDCKFLNSFWHRRIVLFDGDVITHSTCSQKYLLKFLLISSDITWVFDYKLQSFMVVDIVFSIIR